MVYHVETQAEQTLSLFHDLLPFAPTFAVASVCLYLVIRAVRRL